MAIARPDPRRYTIIRGRELTMENRLREWREKAKISMNQLATAVGTTAATISRLETGERSLTKEWAERIAPILDVRPAALILSEAELNSIRSDNFAQISPQSVRVVGSVQAGAWAEAVEWDVSQSYAVYWPGLEGYSPSEAYGLEVRGTSMNEIYPEGSVAICIPLLSLNRDIGRLERVHVETIRGGEVEATIKEYRLDDDGRVWLWPRSTDPRWQQPVHYTPEAGDDSVEVVIKGVVVGSYRPE